MDNLKLLRASNHNNKQQQQQQSQYAHPIDKHWFMLVRRVYLTYNAILASLLVTLQGISFGIQLFYMFRLVEQQEKNITSTVNFKRQLMMSAMNSSMSSMSSSFGSSSSIGSSLIPTPSYSNARIVCYQLSIVGMLGVTCFTFASLLSKSVQFIRLIWSHDQFTKISEKFTMFLVSFRTECSIPRWVDLFLQLMMIIVLEIVPIVCGVVFMVTFANVSIGVQAFLSVGSFVTLAVILLWWLGSVVESYKRLLMFVTHRRKYFERMRSSQHNLDELAEKHEHEQQQQQHEQEEQDLNKHTHETALEPLDRVNRDDDDLTRNDLNHQGEEGHMNGGDYGNHVDGFEDDDDDGTLGSAIEAMDNGVEDGEMEIEAEDGVTSETIHGALNQAQPDVSPRKGDVESALSQTKEVNVKVSKTKTTVVLGTTTQQASPTMRPPRHSRQPSDSYISILNASTLDEISEYHEVKSVAEAPTARYSSNFVDVSKERNLWILLAWYCCLTPIGIPNLVRRFRDRSSKAKVYFLIRELWIVLAMLVLIICVSALGVIQQWKVYTLSAVTLGVIILNMLINKFVYIPAHKPSKKRLKSAWRDSFMQRYIAVIEEVFYNSPEVVFTSSKLLTYLFVMVLAVCGVFDFSDYHLIFILPLFLCAYICFLYILRFNIKNYIASIKRWIPKWLSRKSIEEKDEKDPNAVVSAIGEASNLLRVPFSSKADIFLGGTRQVPAYLHNGLEHSLFRVLSVMTFTSVTLVLVVALLILTGVSVSWAAMLVLLGMLFSVCFVLFKRFEQDAADSLFGFFFFYIVLMGCVFVIGGLSDNANEVRDYARTGVIPNNTKMPYDICSERWHGYSIIDYAFFATLAYSDDPYWTHDFKTWFPQCHDCRVVARYNETIYFYDLYVPAKNLSIVGVRGTTTAQDIIQDFDIWKEAVLLQGASLLGPFVTFWPERLTTGIIYWIYRIELFTMNPSMEQQRFYYQVLDEYVEDIKTQRNVVLAGHSLGGGLAKIVGARHGLPSISFSAPGVVWSRRKLGLSIENINRVDVNVKPGVDLVARIDRDGGLVQNIDCDLSFVECHSIVRTTQNLISSCTSLDNGRNRWVV